MTTSFIDYKIYEMSVGRSGSLRDIPLTDFTMLLSASIDDGNLVTNIGFPFTFEGESYTQANVTTNGCVQLVGTGKTLLGPVVLSYDPSMLSSQLWQDPVFAPWYSDQGTANATHRGGIYQLVRPLGYGGHMESIFRFVMFGTYNDTDTNFNFINYEVILNTLGTISFNYAPVMTVGSPSPPTSLVGVGMNCRDGLTPRYKLIKGTAIPNLLLPNDFPCVLNHERSYILSPPVRIVASNSPVTNVKVTR